MKEFSTIKQNSRSGSVVIPWGASRWVVVGALLVSGALRVIRIAPSMTQPLSHRSSGHGDRGT
eukprot:3700906-Pyramimonas_sp.AAC.1